MPLLQVRDCPADLYRKISYTAKKQNRTIAQQVVEVLQKGMGQESSNLERRKEVLTRIKSRKAPGHALKMDDAALIRKDRAR